MNIFTIDVPLCKDFGRILKENEQESHFFGGSTQSKSSIRRFIGLNEIIIYFAFAHINRFLAANFFICIS